MSYKRAIQTINGRLDGHYQHEGVKWMLARETVEAGSPKGGILADDMGLGKTMQAIATMRGNPMKTLIVSIVGTVAQWRDALIDFGGYKPVVLNPSFTGILPDLEVLVTTYSVFQRDCGALNAIKKVAWGRIILDEGHIIRNKNTRVYKELCELSSQPQSQSQSRWILSGTPIQNSKKDILNLAQWIGYSNIQDIDTLINTIFLRRVHEEQAALNPRMALPPLDTRIIRLSFNTEVEKSFYKDVEDQIENAIHKNKNQNDTIEHIMRCRQACTHPLLYHRGMHKKEKKRKHDSINNSTTSDMFDEDFMSSKFKFIVDDIASVPKQKCLIFCTWTLEMKLLHKHLTARNISCLMYDGKISRDNKEAVLYNYKKTNIQVLILQINCGSAGLNLQCASRIYISTPQWNPCIELQAIGRAYRKGQTEVVKCFRVCMEGTIEEKCTDVQDDKIDIISEIIGDRAFTSRMGTFDS